MIKKENFIFFFFKIF